MHHTLLWIGFGVIVIAMMILDLGIFNKRAHSVGIREALIWSVVWIGLALCFNGWIYVRDGREDAVKFLTGYLLEKSLSVDNLFVFLLIFSYFNVSKIYQHKILSWGIIGAMIMRMIFIALGVTLINKFHWIIYFFGAFLIYTGIQLARENEKEIHPEKNPVLKIFRKLFPVTNDYHEGNFFIRQANRWVATPMFIVLLVVETTDVVFAIDSIPAILAVTTDPFLVYTSNIFAIMGLRSLYFALSGLMQLFQYLNYGLALILVFIGVKMLVSEHYPIPTGWALGFIAMTLVISIVVSVLFPKKKNDEVG